MQDKPGFQLPRGICFEETTDPMNAEVLCTYEPKGSAYFRNETSKVPHIYKMQRLDQSHGKLISS